ncbi:CRE_collapsed_G0054240.mRNA.1.CDS.1 [Saccharomyces cerevisiae]|nr:Acm1p [Saccharomyces cerevisiae YJM1460]AJW24983.1 Acm1p [Saccharomyces cerevisiae YJM689]CAI4907008.1 CRE_HP_G0007380.mRNA.1.CDS.1 [Saccharomyces cerevisiae]CAI4915099.1 CRE_HP_G0013080.mRNA.1.CDS.1 [Saccharomyces cerevisiae]CAI4977027.1 CRE_HP_G0055200.mRNA.1.CDS.1 [Saccharomyces cerevisiae]
MISPSKKRTILSSKNINQKPRAVVKGNELRSPSKRRSQIDTDYALRRSPIKTIQISKAAQFMLYEETAEERNITIHRHNEIYNNNNSVSNENNPSQVKENLSPAKICPDERAFLREGERIALKDLSVDEFKGYIQDPLTDETIPLTLPLGEKKISLPSFITPPRNSKISIFFTSKHQGQNPETKISRSTDDVSEKKVVRKLSFHVYEDE